MADQMSFNDWSPDLATWRARGHRALLRVADGAAVCSFLVEHGHLDDERGVQVVVVATQHQPSVRSTKQLLSELHWASQASEVTPNAAYGD